MTENDYSLEKIIEHENRKAGILRGVVILILAVAVILALTITKKTLPDDVHFRTAFYSVTCTVCFLVILFDLIVLGVLLHRFMQAGWRRAFATVAAVIVIILYVIGGSLAMFFMVLDSDKEEMLDDGRILVTEPHFLGANTYYVAVPYHIFFKKTVYASDSQGYKISMAEDSDVAAEPVTYSDEAETEPIPEASSEDLSENAVSSDQQYIDSDNRWIADLYEQIYTQKLTELDESGAGVVYGMTAKGELIAYVGDSYEKEIQGEVVNAQLRMVYDRVSENGLAHLVVLYEDHYDTAGNRIDNTSIINFYAVRDGEVIAADKTSWAEVGSAEYREATGE